MIRLKFTCFVTTVAIAAGSGSVVTVFSQGIYNESHLHVNGVDVYVDGHVTNGGTLDNDGLISFTGNWSSEGKYKGRGVVSAAGTSPQIIAHFGQQMGRLFIGGGGAKYIGGSLSVASELTLSQGIVHVASDDALKLLADATVSGGSSETFVDGALTVAGTGYKFFPIGKNGTYAPIEFLDVKGTDAEYSVEVFEHAPMVTVENVILQRSIYWQRKDIGGSFGGSAIALGFNRENFDQPPNILLVTGSGWDDPFVPVEDLYHSTETDKVITNIEVSQPIMMLGEASGEWRDSRFYFSTALSPNAARPENKTVKIFGDGLRDVDFAFEVFNRWGDRVFQTSSLASMSSNGWDGRNNKGSLLMSGSYPYRLTAVDKLGRKIEKKGVITIIH